MPKADKFKPGDLVFAKVKGYPPWPARISGYANSFVKFAIYFYGTYETATLKSEDIWYYNEDTAKKFGPKYIKKKGYREGMYQIEHTPDIAGYNETLPGKAASTPSLDTSRVDVSPQRASPPKALKRKAEDDPDTPQIHKKLAMSPSVRLIKPKIAGSMMAETERELRKSIEESPSKKEGGEEEEGRKLWVKVKDTDDIIEINLDKDRPDSFPSDEAKKEWEMASAKKALKFKKKVESGEFVPPEILKRLEERAQRSPEERERLDKERKLERSKDKLRWLKIEQRLVELDIAIKTSLNLSRPSPDRCIQALEELAELYVAPLMLKKQPDIVSTIKRLRRYVGPQGYKNWSDDEARSKLERSIKSIQIKAERVFAAFKECFSCQEEDEVNFLAKFWKEVQEFKDHTQDWDERKMLSMTRDPTRPISKQNPLTDDEA